MLKISSIVGLILILLIPSTGHAYIDPGTGFVVATGVGWMIAMVAGLFGGLGMFFKRFLFKTVIHTIISICSLCLIVGTVIFLSVH